MEQVTCFDLLYTSVCTQCQHPVMSNEPNTICEECFHKIVAWARKENLFGSESHWQGT